MALPAERAALPAFARELAREARAELVRLRRIRGPGQRTARRIARARARLALAAVLLAAPLGEPALARTPIFVNLLEPYGLRDVGADSTPTFADIDADGDLDAFVGELEGNAIFFRNTGTARVPAFATPETNPFGFTDIGGLSTLAFADINGDDDLDVVLGEAEGGMAVFTNGGGTSNPAFFFAGVLPFDVGFDADPTFADLDGDGDFDLFVGEAYGNTHFFENTGTVQVPNFVAAVINPFGLGGVGGEASPRFADLDGDGDLDVLMGEFDTTTFFLNLAPLCPAAPDPSCAAFAAGSLSVDERKPGKEKLTARLSKGPDLAQAAFGDPTDASGTTVALCLYDDAGAPVTNLVVDRGGESCGSKPCWKPVGKAPPEGKGFSYKDPSRSADGMGALKLQGGAAGRSSVALSASNRAAKGQTALPTGIAAQLATTSEVTLQVHTSDAACFGATLSEVTRQDPERFKAR